MLLKSPLGFRFGDPCALHRVRLVASGLFLLVLCAASLAGSFARLAPRGSAPPVTAGPSPSIIHITKEPGPEVPTFYQVLDEARASCSRSKPTLLLEDNRDDAGSALAVASYSLYPAIVQAVSAEAPGRSIDPRSGGWGCVLTFGSKGAPLLLPYRDELQELACSVQGCAYRIR